MFSEETLQNLRRCPPKGYGLSCREFTGTCVPTLILLDNVRRDQALGSERSFNIGGSVRRKYVSSNCLFRLTIARRRSDSGHRPAR